MKNVTQENFSCNDSSILLTSDLIKNIRPSALSVDTTNLCNLRCKHCFWDAYQNNLPSINNLDILSNVKSALEKFPTITNITWYGGEPLLSKQTISIVEHGVKLRKNNLIITNGTIEIPKWEGNIHFAISIDGTEKIHDYLRGNGTYAKLKNTARSAVSRNIPTAAIFCLNAINMDCIEEFLHEWSSEGLIGIVFTAYAPIKNKLSELELNNAKRDRIIDTLLLMKTKYPTLICNTEQMIKLISGKHNEEIANNCLMNIQSSNNKVYSIHMCNDGTIRVPCALGKDANCLECRSVTQLALYSGLILRDKSSLFALFRMYHSKPHKNHKTAS
jgi:MoaA/NifB/PqqE/SkfB family radical SAM enzyme